MAIQFVSSAITSVGGDGVVNAAEASPIGFQISGTGVYEQNDPTNNQAVPVTLTFSGGLTQTVPAVITDFDNAGTKTFRWTITDTTLFVTPPHEGPVAVVVKFPDSPGEPPATQSEPFPFIFDKTAPSSPSILSITDDVGSVTGPLTSGNVTDDSDLTVSVGLPGQGFGANVGDTVQLYNGSDTTNPLGAHILTTEDFNVGAVDVQTGVLPDGAIDLTVRLVDPAGNASVVSAAFALTVVCFARGTHLLTSTGEVPVEALQPGMPMVANDGTVASVKWIGRRRIDLTTHPRPETVAPIRIQRDAFADNMPHSDLLVSPDHAIFVDGKLICARQLINGTTIRQEKDWTAVEYFHVELDAHTILLAEGLPAESYLNTGNQGFFANSDAPMTLHPDLTDESDYPTREAASCAPFVCDEGNVRPVWQRLAERATALGEAAPQLDTTTDPALHIVANGRRVQPLHGENGLYIFPLPKGAAEVRVVSRAGSPTDVRPWLDDRRCLGVHVERIVLRDANNLREVPVDHPGLSRGWWAVEKNGMALRRWTNGDAVLPLPDCSSPAMLEIRLGGEMAYAVTARPEAGPERKVA